MPPSRADIARGLIRRFRELTYTTPPWPRSNVQLEFLKDQITILEKRKSIHDEITRSGYTIDENFQGSDKYFRFTPRGNQYRHISLTDIYKILTDILPNILEKKPLLKVGLQYEVVMYSTTNPEKTINTNLRAHTRIITRTTDLEDLANDFFADITKVFESFSSYGSDWALKDIKFIQLSVYEYTPATGSSYVPLPPKIVAKKACINVKNSDDKCVLWALLSALFPASDHVDRVSKYKPYQDRINMTGIDFPTPVQQVAKIESNNRELFPMGINVFSINESFNVFPLLISPSAKHSTGASTVNLLLHQNHYVYIKDLSKLLSSDISKHDHKLYYCYGCLNGFYSQEKLIDHNQYCCEVKATTTPTPDDNILKFTHYDRATRLPFIIYGDFESFLVSVDSKCVCEEYPCDCNFKTAVTQKHIPASYQLNTVCVNEKYSKLSPIYHFSTTTKDPEVHMLKYLFDEVARIEQLQEPVDVSRFTKMKSYESATICCCCYKPFTEKYPKVPFYNTIVEKYIGAAHKKCSKVQNFYPVVFHNLRGYDGHFIVRALGHPEIAKYCEENKISLGCIPNNTERLMSVTIGKLRFIDSYQFMGSSLQQLARSCSNFPAIKSHFGEDKFTIVTTKRIFPYDYFNGPARFEETSLPTKDKFYSAMAAANGSQCDIDDSDYEYAKRVWDEFSCKTFADYHDLYLTVDVLLLTDIFENFRSTSLNNYGLDPAYYYSAPGLSWDALLKSTKIELELLTDVDMYLFIEKAIRGGISVIIKKHSRANNRYLKKFDPNSEINFITYLDMNNLYGAAMCSKMPYGSFKWITPEYFLLANSDWQSGVDLSGDLSRDLSAITLKPTNDDIGYFVEVDVDYPQHLHDSHNDYPYLTEKMIVTNDMLSQEQLALKTTKTKPTGKLVPNLLPKRNYVCHYSILNQALQAGLILKKVHKVLQFKHSTWMKSYIDGNTVRRAAATSDFEKDFFKLMNNSVFGKTMENIRKRVNIEIVNRKARRDKLTRNNRFIESKKITEDLALITMVQARLLLNKPAYIGAAVLDISKLFMYDFHYGFTKVNWPDAKLLFTDTDSLVYEIPGSNCNNDLYESIYKHKSLFDLSDVDPKGSLGKFNDNTNKKVIGKMKDEFAFNPVREFVGLRSKMYAVITESNKEVKKAKGINNAYVKNKLKFIDYLEALKGTPQIELSKITTLGFRSTNHKIYTEKIIKSGLSNYDDKRYCSDGINTLAYGHYLLRGVG